MNVKKKLDQGCGLVLSGGGARGAYQAGAIVGLLRLAQKHHLSWPFPYITGQSAGGINACALAALAQKPSYDIIAERLYQLWGALESQDVYDTRPLQMTFNGLNWLSHLSLGRVRTTSTSLSLLNNAPLRKFLKEHMRMELLHGSVKSGIVKAVALNAVSYSTGFSRTFFMSHTPHPGWVRDKRDGIEQALTHDHILASSAIPLVFSPIKIRGDYYGDGSVRDYTPLAPSIHLGAKKILVVGVRKRDQKPSLMAGPPTPAKIFGTIFNALLLDSIDSDIERLEKINYVLKEHPQTKQTGLKPIPYLFLTPSQVISDIAEQERHKMPRTLKYFLNGLGKPHEASDIISYLLFEKSFTKRLMDLGIRDVEKREEEILHFLTTPHGELI